MRSSQPSSLRETTLKWVGHTLKLSKHTLVEAKTLTYMKNTNLLSFQMFQMSGKQKLVEFV